jgi:hypothetical protein
MDSSNYPYMQNREKLKYLCGVAGSYSAAVKLIIDQSKRGLSVDALKSWTCNAESSRARRCPDWIIEVLEKQLGNTVNTKNT